MHTQAGQREAGNHQDGDIHEHANHAAGSGTKREEETIRVELASLLHTRPTSLSGFR